MVVLVKVIVVVKGVLGGVYANMVSGIGQGLLGRI